MAVWFLDNEGRAVPLLDHFTPAFYARGPQNDLHDVCRMLRTQRAPVGLRRTERRDLFLDQQVEVLEVGVRFPALLQRLQRQVAEFRPHLTYYDADIPIPQRYVLARGIFPLAYCRVEHADGRLIAIEALDSPWDAEYRLPQLRVMTLRLDGELRNPARGYRSDLLVEAGGQSYVFKRDQGRQLVLGVRHLLEQHDPDLLVSAYGDSFILPRLIELSRHYGLPLPLNRDHGQAVGHKRAHSYFSYGKVIFRDEQHTLFGRWHIDRQNAFLADDYGLDGNLEIARLTGLPVQTVARVSTGTGISAMQVATALRRGVLVPWQKRQPEALKTGLDLFAADKGGLVYTPIAGLHEHVAELDFTAMYPSLMVHFNLSPETVKAECCPGVPVPELGTPVCNHRQGLVPETLAPLLEKRARYKALMRALPEDDPRREVYRRRYSAHKWLLVTCFGYLGYKNARFGRIEAHEAVTAYGREVLLQAKEIVEARGYRVLHMYVDGLWIHKPGARGRPDYEGLLEVIKHQTGLPIELEGVYRWLAFLPSRTEPRVAVANRYFGAFQDGSIKIRGIEARRHDTPAYIKDTQLHILEILADGRDAAGFRALLPKAVAYATERLRLPARRAGAGQKPGGPTAPVARAGRVQGAYGRCPRRPAAAARRGPPQRWRAVALSVRARAGEGARLGPGGPSDALRCRSLYRTVPARRRVTALRGQRRPVNARELAPGRGRVLGAARRAASSRRRSPHASAGSTRRRRRTTAPQPVPVPAAATQDRYTGHWGRRFP